MSDNNGGNSEITIEPDFGEGTRVSQNRDGIFTTHEAGAGVRLSDEEEAQLEADVEAGLREGEEPDSAEAGKGEEEGSPNEEKPQSVAIDLPDFDPEKPEVKEQYATKYLTEDGKALNFSAFNDSFYANLKAGLVDINPQERAFVKSEMGISDEAIDTYLGGLATQAGKLQEQQDTALFTAFGGGTADKDGYTAAFAWATGEGGYTAAQKERFNAALDAQASGDNSLMEEQVELLKVRFSASGKAPVKAEPTPAQKVRRPVSPQASATGGAAAAGGAEPFATIEDFNKAQSEAYRSGDRKAMLEVSARMKASPKLWRDRH
jgi:hypothetical protein